jgi:cytochrome c biogenesis protein CcmG/thiol:disulfide interchange protein DsbE
VKVRARWFIPLAALPVVGLLAYGFRTDPRAVPSPLVGRPAPAFELTTFDGKSLSLDGQRGKVVVLNFWASWCYPACYEEAPVLEAGWLRSQAQGVVVLGVAIQDKQPASLEFIQRFGLTFPNAPDPAGKVSIDYGVYGVPETFVIDRRGVIRRKHVGAVTEAVFREWVEPLLGESAAAGEPRRTLQEGRSNDRRPHAAGRTATGGTRRPEGPWPEAAGRTATGGTRRPEGPWPEAAGRTG